MYEAGDRQIFKRYRHCLRSFPPVATMNLQGKLSGLKGLVSHSPSKRRFKADLTVDMISPPLSDFRHTMHVGRGGDVFGDTSFLSNHGGTANGNGDTDSVSAPDNKIGAFFSRTLRHVRKTSDNSPRAGAKELAKELSPPPPPISPIIKNAISLPRLDVDLPNGSPTAKVLFPNSPSSSVGESRCSYGLESGFVTLPRLSRLERQQPSISISTSTSCSPGVHRGSLTDATDAILSTCSTPMVTSDRVAVCSTTAHSDSLPSLTSLDTFTFTLDLGPSLMSEVFGLIDSAGDGQSYGACHAWEVEEAGSACGLTTEGSEMDSATISYVDSLLREDCGSRKSPYGAEWEEEEEEAGKMADINGGGHPLQGPVPDIVMGSPGRERMGMGKATVSERFHVVGGLSKGQNRMDSEMVIMNEMTKKMSYSYVDDEEEIKV